MLHPPSPHHQPKPWEPRSPFVLTVLDQSPRLERPRLEHSACLTAPVRFFSLMKVVIFHRFPRPKRLDFSEGLFVDFFWVAGVDGGGNLNKNNKNWTLGFGVRGIPKEVLVVNCGWTQGPGDGAKSLAGKRKWMESCGKSEKSDSTK